MMSTETLILGGLLIASLMVFVRIFRKGLSTFDQHFNSFRQAVRATEKQVREGNLSISLLEQMTVIRAALDEELDLAGRPKGYYVDAKPKVVRLHTPQGPFEITFMCKTTRLHSQNKVLHGGGAWTVCGPQGVPLHTQSLGQTMQYLQKVIQGCPVTQDEGEAFRRRFPE
ncbi:MAG: hypothetical protein RRY29_08965 [Desulfovibrionaceae bacterium]